MASLQRRVGPNIHGYYGVFQPFLDGVKLLTKELLIPAKANFYIFLFSPLLMMTLSFSLWAIIPLSFNFSIFDSHFSLLFFFILSSLNVYNIILAGWSSNSKYAFLGSVRAIAQFLSYELIFGFALLFMLLFIGSLRIFAIIYKQYYIGFLLYPLLPFALIFFVVLLMETNRAPFDLPEAESELVAGYNVEYSSIMFAMFFLGEYCNIISMSSIWIILFWGGFAAHSYGPVFFILKILLFCFLFIFIRSLLPRYRLDQLIYVGWHVMLPVCIGILFFLTSLLALTQSAALTVIATFYRPILSWTGLSRVPLKAHSVKFDDLVVDILNEYSFSILQWMARTNYAVHAFSEGLFYDLEECGYDTQKLIFKNWLQHFVDTYRGSRSGIYNAYYGSPCNLNYPGLVGLFQTASLARDVEALTVLELSKLKADSEESLLLAWSPYWTYYAHLGRSPLLLNYHTQSEAYSNLSDIDCLLKNTIGPREPVSAEDTFKKFTQFAFYHEPINNVSLLHALDLQLNNRIDFPEYSRAVAWKLRYKHPLHFIYDVFWKSGLTLSRRSFIPMQINHQINQYSFIPDIWAFIESREMRPKPKEFIKDNALELYSTFPLYDNTNSEPFKTEN